MLRSSGPLASLARHSKSIAATGINTRSIRGVPPGPDIAREPFGAPDGEVEQVTRSLPAAVAEADTTVRTRSPVAHGPQRLADASSK